LQSILPFMNFSAYVFGEEGCPILPVFVQFHQDCVQIDLNSCK